MRNVTVLTCAQALSASGMTVVPLLGGIVGTQLAPQPALGTLPVSLAIVGLALSTVPAALLMRRVGRKRGFIASALAAAMAAALAATALYVHSFVLFCLAAVLLGANAAFTLQYRFAAAESVGPEQVSRAVARVMVGTLMAAWAGPEIALATRNLWPEREFAGSFLAVSVMYVVAAMILSRLAPVSFSGSSATVRGSRPMSHVITQPAYLTAVLAGVIAYVVMSFIMTATPISMHVIDGHGVDDTAWVIQSHLLAMYLPSLASGWMIERLGIRPMMLLGTLLMIVCVVIDTRGHHVMHYWWALVLLGVGWNLLFVSGTTLLTTTYRASERHRAQAVNELAVFGTQALASLLAGVAIQTFGWRDLNIITLPVLGLMLLAAARPGFALRRD